MTAPLSCRAQCSNDVFDEFHWPWTGDRLMTVGHSQNNGKDPKDPKFREFIMIGADGVNLDPQGRIVFCTFTGRSVDRIEKELASMWTNAGVPHEGAPCNRQDRPKMVFAAARRPSE
jgi:hypothetical protein